MLEWIAGKLAGQALTTLIPWKWVGIIGGVLAIAFFILWLLWSRAELRADNEYLRSYSSVLEAANESHLATIDGLQKAEAAKEKALAAREEENRRIDAERKKFQRRLQEAIRNEPETRAWADTALPDSVRELFQ